MITAKAKKVAFVEDIIFTFRSFFVFLIFYNDDDKTKIE